MNIQRHQFNLFADYFQFYIQDELAVGDLGDSWTPAATDRLLAIAPGTVGVGTVRNMFVPVDVEIRPVEPEPQFKKWDQVVECSMDVSSGRIVVAGCTDYLPDAARIIVPPGTYRVRVHYGNLNSISSDGLEGADRYELALWPGAPADPVVLKARTAGRPAS